MIRKVFAVLVAVALIVLTCVACKSNEAAIICGNCATRLPESSLYCSNCGTMLFQNNVNTPPSNAPTSTPTEVTQPSTQGTTQPTTQPAGTSGTTDVWNGVVTTSGSQLNIRSGPSFDDPVVGLLENGDSVTIVERKTVNGFEWGRIEEGWVFMDYICLIPNDSF